MKCNTHGDSNNNTEHHKKNNISGV